MVQNQAFRDLARKKGGTALLTWRWRHGSSRSLLFLNLYEVQWRYLPCSVVVVALASCPADCGLQSEPAIGRVLNVIWRSLGNLIRFGRGDGGWRVHPGWRRLRSGWFNLSERILLRQDVNEAGRPRPGLADGGRAV